MKIDENNHDERVTRSFFSFPAYIAFVFAFAVIMALPTVFYGGMQALMQAPEYIKWYFLYCIVLATFFISLFAIQKYLRIDRPLHRLSYAAKQVAEGDFSVYLPIRHAPNSMDYIDVLYQDFNTMVDELGSIETLKNDFAANVSHELKTPLSIISNHAQLLKTTELTEKQEEYIDGILEGTERLTSLIYNILRLNKLESQKIKAKPASYNLCEQLAQCAISFETIWEKKNIEFEADIEDSAIIEADYELMSIVWNNLLSNALKFTPNGGMVSIKEYSDNKHVFVEVSDTGCGMSPQVMKHIFDKFYQADTSHSTPGNGLGLALTLRVLQLNEGTITVNSKEGEGSVFTVLLPKKEAKEEFLHYGTNQ